MIVSYTCIILWIILLPVLYGYFDSHAIMLSTIIISALVQFYSIWKLSAEFRGTNDKLSKTLSKALTSSPSGIWDIILDKTEDPDRLLVRKHLFILWTLYFLAFIVAAIVSSV